MLPKDSEVTIGAVSQLIKGHTLYAGDVMLNAHNLDEFLTLTPNRPKLILVTNKDEVSYSSATSMTKFGPVIVGSVRI